MKFEVATLMMVLLETAATAGGIQGVDGRWYCDTGYVATPNGCVETSKQPPAPASDLKPNGNLPPHIIDVGGGLYSCETGYTMVKGQCVVNNEVTKDGPRVEESTFGMGSYWGAHKTEEKVVGKSYTDVPNNITATCVSQWPGNYRMQAYCMGKQDGAAKDLRKVMNNQRDEEPVAGAVANCQEQYGDDYAMVKHCLEHGGR